LLPFWTVKDSVWGLVGSRASKYECFSTGVWISTACCWSFGLAIQTVAASFAAWADGMTLKRYFMDFGPSLWGGDNDETEFEKSVLQRMIVVVTGFERLLRFST
jgi:hypothetical protein